MSEKYSGWRWVFHPDHEGIRLHDVGMHPDGRLHNPNAYPDDVVKRAIEAALARRAEKRKEKRWSWLEPDGLTPEEQAAILANNQARRDKQWERDEPRYRRSGYDDSMLAKMKPQADARLWNITLKADDTLVNPCGYPEEIIRHAIEYKGKQGARTRQRRREKLINEIATKAVRDEKIGPSDCCIICRKPVTDPASIERGIGSDCWQHVLQRIEKLQMRRAA